MYSYGSFVLASSDINTKVQLCFNRTFQFCLTSDGLNLGNAGLDVGLPAPASDEAISGHVAFDVLADLNTFTLGP